MNATRDENRVPVLIGVSSVDGTTIVPVQADSNGRLLVDVSGGGGGSVDWGDIGGTLTSQTDLQSALDDKLDASDLPGTKNSIEVDSDDYQLVGDAASPGNLKYYGTNGSGAKGFHDIPTGGTVNWGDIGGTLSAQTDLQNALNAKADTSSLAAVATSGDYDDLTNKPTLPTGAIVGTTDTQTLTNKRINPRVQSVASSATVTPNADNDDCVDITAQAAGLTIANTSGTPVNFQKIIIRIRDNGTARSIDFGTDYVPCGIDLPTTTTISKTLVLGFMYNTANSLNKWQLIALTEEQ